VAAHPVREDEQTQVDPDQDVVLVVITLVTHVGQSAKNGSDRNAAACVGHG
jgi:hypothetical protein